MGTLADLSDRIDSRDARIGVIGLGYVGLPLAMELGGEGFRVTGFDVDKFLWPAEYHGEGGVSLRDYWAPHSPRAYLGMMVPRFPNFFMLYGPNSQPVSGGISLPSWFQIWAAYIAQCLHTMFEEGHAQLSVKEKAFETYNAELDAVGAELAFIKDTRSVERNYYVNAEEGRLVVNTPYETAELYAMQKAPNRDELEFGS